MRILISVEHPAWAHQFRYLIPELERKGHIVKVVAINKDRDLELLDAFNIKYDVISHTSGKTVIDKGIIFLKTLVKIYQISRKFKPDIYIGRASPMMAINSFLFRKKHIVFEDTEHSGFCLFMARLFTDVILTPDCFKKNLGGKQRRINTYKEIFYLHPNYFAPNPDVLSELNLSPQDKFIILRFVAWEAHHDMGQRGLDMEAKRQAVAELGKYARVFITSESPLPEEFEKYRITLPPEKLHDLLYYAALCISEGGTTASEAAVLGTPSIHISTTAKYCGIFEDLYKNYGLIYAYSSQEEAMAKAIGLLSKGDSKQEWQKKREKMLADKIDGTQFMVDLIENYPDSFEESRALELKGTR